MPRRSEAKAGLRSPSVERELRRSLTWYLRFSRSCGYRYVCSASSTPRGLSPNVLQSRSELSETSSGRAGREGLEIRDTGWIREASYPNPFAMSSPNSALERRSGPPQCQSPGSLCSVIASNAFAASTTCTGVRYSSANKESGLPSLKAFSIQPSTPFEDDGEEPKTSASRMTAFDGV